MKKLNEYENSGNEKIISKSFLLMFLTSINSAMVLYVMISPVAELCYNLSNDLALAGFASGAYIIGGTFSIIFMRYFFRKWGLKKTGIIFLTIHFLTCFLYFLPLNVTNLLIIRFIHGFGIGIGFTAITTITAQIIPKKHHGKGFGIFYLAEPVAIGLCSLINIVFNQYASFSFYLIIAAIFSGVTLLGFSAVKFDEKKLSEESKKFKLQADNFIDISTLPIAIFTMLSCFGYIALLTFSQIYSTKVNLVNAFNYFFLIYMVTVIISRPLFGLLQDKYGNSIVSIMPIILQSSGLFLLFIYPCEAIVYLSAIFTALGYGTLYSIGISMATEYVAKEREYIAIATYVLFNDLALGFGATILGLFTFMGIGGIYLLSSILSILGLPICLYVLKIHEKKII